MHIIFKITEKTAVTVKGLDGSEEACGSFATAWLRCTHTVRVKKLFLAQQSWLILNVKAFVFSREAIFQYNYHVPINRKWVVSKCLRNVALMTCICHSILNCQIGYQSSSLTLQSIFLNVIYFMTSYRLPFVENRTQKHCTFYDCLLLLAACCLNSLPSSFTF